MELNKNNFVRWQGSFNTNDQCSLVVGAITLSRSGTTFTASFSLTGGTADHYTVEVNDGGGFNPIAFTGTASPLIYTHSNATHTVRITPYCSATQAGTAATATYTAVICTPVTAASWTPGTAQVGQSYTRQIALSGTAPFSVSPASQSWLNASISGSTLTLSGTPTASGTLNVSLTVTNACGSAPVTGTITVNPQTGYNRKFDIHLSDSDNSHKVIGSYDVNNSSQGTYTVFPNTPYHGTYNASGTATVVMHFSLATVPVTNVQLFIIGDQTTYNGVLSNSGTNNSGDWTFAGLDLSSGGDIAVYINGNIQ